MSNNFGAFTRLLIEWQYEEIVIIISVCWSSEKNKLKTYAKFLRIKTPALT